MEDLPTETAPLPAAGQPVGLAGGGEDYVSLFRVAALLIGSRRDLCLVKRICRNDAVLRAYGSLRSGEAVKLELKGQAPIDGTVDSAAGPDIRIRFFEPVDVLRLLRVGAGGPPARMPRVDVRAFALIRQGGMIHRATVNNVSQGGISAECKDQLQVGKEATVTLAGLDPQPGVVRWSGSGGCGITFNSVLGLPALVEWLHAHSSAKGASS